MKGKKVEMIHQSHFISSRTLAALGLLLLVFGSLPCPAGIREYSAGNWQFTLDTKSGELHDISYRQNMLLNRLSRNLQFPEQKNAPLRLYRHRFDAAALVLDLVFQIPEAEIRETIQFDAHATPGLIRREAELHFRVAEPKLFGNYTMLTRISAENEYYMPAAILGDVRSSPVIRNDPRPAATQEKTDQWKGQLSALAVGRSLQPSEHGNGIILLRTPAGTTLTFLNDERVENIYSRLRKENSRFGVVSQRVDCEGWALPGAIQRQIGPVYLQLHPDTEIDDALKALHTLYRKIHALPPQDRPDWVAHGMVYELNPLKNMDENGLHLLAEELLPRIAGMNFNVVYIQPAAEGTSNYLPIDHRVLHRFTGGTKAYRNFLDRLNSLGLRAWQDIVPHGSWPKDTEDRGGDIFQRVFRKDGQLNPYSYTTDYLNPGWSAYMRETASFWMKHFPLAGFRIDMPYGSPKNFRRAGFPARKPDGIVMPRWQSPNGEPVPVSEAWWENSLAAYGGKVPALEYDRASRSTRGGGLTMVKNIRTEARRANPDAAVLAEVLSPFQSVTADVIYDLLYDTITFPLLNMDNARFANLLQRYLQERKWTGLPGQLYLRVFQSHDVPRTWSFLGTGLGNCAYATCVLSRGLPLLDCNMDIGHGEFIARLQKIRSTRRELNQGPYDFLAVKTSPGIWSVLHGKGENCSIGLINFTPKKQVSRITLPAGVLQFSGKRSLVNAMNSRLIATGTDTQLRSFSITLAPFETAVVVSEPVSKLPSVSTQPEPQHNPRSVSDAIELEETAKKIVIRAPGYLLELDRSTGLPDQLHNAVGRKVMARVDLLFSSPQQHGKVQLRIDRKNNLVSATYPLDSQAKLLITYRFHPKEIDWSATISGPPRNGYAAFSLPMANYAGGSWRVAGIDGLLADRFWETILPVSRIPGLNAHTEYRDQTGTILWNSEQILPDYSNARCAMYDKDGNGFELFSPEPLRTYPAMIQFRRRTGYSQQPGAVVYLYSPSELTAGLPQMFHLILRPADAAERYPEFSKPVCIGQLTLTGRSSDYQVENHFFSLRLRRLNGAIRQLADKRSGQTLLQDLFVQESGNGALAGDKFDTDASARFFLRNQNLVFRTCGISKDNHRAGVGSRHTWIRKEYLFSAAPGFRALYSIRPEYKLSGNSFQVIARIPPPLACSTADLNQFVLRDRAGAQFTGKLKGFYHAYCVDDTLKLFAINGKHQSRPGQWHPFRISFLVPGNGTLPELPPPEEKPDLRTLRADQNIFGFGWSSRSKKSIPFRLSSLYPTLFHWTPGSIVSFCGYDREDLYSDELSALLPGAWWHRDYKRVFRPWFRMNFSDLKPGSYRIRFAAKFEKIEFPRSTVRCNLTGFDEKGRHISCLSVSVIPATRAGWNLYEFELPAPLKQPLYSPQISISVDSPSCGYSRFSHLEIVPEQGTESGN